MSGPAGDAPAAKPAITPNGAFVVFESTATTFGVAGGSVQVYVHNMGTGQVQLVSRASGASGAAGNASSETFEGPSISDDGRFVAFESAASNLVPKDGNDRPDVFVRDLESQTTTLISRGSNDQSADQSGAYGPQISGDGRYVVFGANSENLASGEGKDGHLHIYRAPATGGAVTHVGGACDCGEPSPYPTISGDASTMAYEDGAELGGGAFDQFVRVAGASSGEVDRGQHPAFLPALSADGRYVGYLYDPGSGKIELRRGPSTGGAGTTAATDVSYLGLGISGDGRYLAFATASGALDPAAPAGGVFVKDMDTGTTTLVSRASGESGAPADPAGSDPAISPDAHFAAFTTSSDLGGNPGNENELWLRQLEPQAPYNTDPPTVLPPQGGPTALGPGGEVTCEEGAWFPAATSYTYRWLRGGQPIEGATSRSYVLTQDDQGMDIACEVTATNESGPGHATSAPLTISTPSAEVPVIFIPGFLGSEIECTNQVGARDNLWPDAILFTSTNMPFMGLAADGKSPDLPGRCARTAGPNGRVFSSTLGSDIYGGAVDFVRRIAGSQGLVFTYDWRKSPGQAADELDSFIDTVRANTGADKVAIMTHSNGGLVTQWYINDPARAAKVARVVDFSTPFWGTPKPWFTMAYGVETPSVSALDAIMPDDQLKEFARNLLGLYYLFPSPSWFAHTGSLGRWLTVDGHAESAHGVLDQVDKDWCALPLKNPAGVVPVPDCGPGNRALLAQAYRGHTDHIDGFRTHGVDYRLMVGTGLPTLGHEFIPSDSNPLARVLYGADYAWINGDGTVALPSARQGLPGKKPLGDPVKEDFFCGIDHMSETETPALQRAVQNFLLRGDAPVGSILHKSPCALDKHEVEAGASGDAISVTALSAAATSAKAGRAAAAGHRVSLKKAEQQRLVEAIRMPGRTVIVTLKEPLVITVGGGKVAVKAARLTNGGERAVRYFRARGAVSLRLVRSKPSVARHAGRRLKPVSRDRTPPRTTVRVRIRKGRAILRFKAHDRSGVAATYITVGKRKPVSVRGSYTVPLSKLRKVRFASVDAFGNVERPRRAHR